MNNKKIAELKTCPFCGGKATAEPALQYEDGRWKPARCGCPECDLWMRGDSSYSGNGFAVEYHYEESMKQAVQRWNRRWEVKRLIRCRDCQFGYQHDCKRYPTDKQYMGKWYCILWGDGMQGEWTRADGFCHRAKPRSKSQPRVA